MRIAAAVRFSFGLNAPIFFAATTSLSHLSTKWSRLNIYEPFLQEYNKNDILGAILFSCSQPKNVQSI